MDHPVKLSIGIITHNHEKFLHLLFQGIFIQKVNFTFEVICFDDASDDQTLNQLFNYQSKYPDLITVLHNTVSKGPNDCAEKVISHFKGEYICWLDGDDYWIYEEKLQKQIDFLDSHPDYNGCFHDAQIVSEFENDPSNHNRYHSEYKYYSQFNKYHPDFYPWDVIERNIIPTASLIFRNNNKIQCFFEAFGDITLSLIWAFQIYLVKDSKFRYINEAWSVYNDHSGGISKTQTLEAFKLSNIKILKRFVKDVYDMHQYSFYYTIAMEYKQILFIRQNSKMKNFRLYKYMLLYTFYLLKSHPYQIKNVFAFQKKFN